MAKRALGICGALAWAAMACGATDTADEVTGESAQSIVRGAAEPNRKQVVFLHIQRMDGSQSRCSASYFAPRVVLTAAHCIGDGVIPAASAAYYGDNYEADLAGQGDIPEPGQPSVWARVDSFEVHPNWSREGHDADLAVAYLDRKLPFDPLPLARFRLDNSWVGKRALEVGWGASLALSADIRQNEGIGVKRSGYASILGTPTEADYHADDPNPAMLNPTARSHYLKMDGRASVTLPNGKTISNVNGCAADSGSPLIINQWGQDYLAGVASFTGLWCEDYSLYTRLDPYLPFLDEAYRKGGQAVLTPRVDCVVPQPDGNYSAYFGYKNDNGVSVTVPYGSKNYLPLDVDQARPTRFLPGVKDGAFRIDFTRHQTVRWTLSPENSPTTTVTASPRASTCPDTNNFSCVRQCEATMASPCVDEFMLDWTICMDLCQTFFDWWPGCDAEWRAYNNCMAGVGPDPENWVCDTDMYWMPGAPVCDDLLMAAFSCG